MPEQPKNLSSLKKKQQKQKNNLNTAARYSGLAFEMLFLILAGVFGGIKLDEKFKLEPLFTVLGALIGVGLALYFALRDLLKKT